MDLQTILRAVLPDGRSLLFIAIRVIFIAIAFEFIAWVVARRIEKHAASFMSLDAGREAKWRATRRLTLRSTPKLLARAVLYTVALVLVFDAFGLQVLPLSLSIAAVTVAIGAALLPTMRDYAQGYTLLSEDTLAPGDVVEINGHTGTVEKWTLRATWLRDAQGRLHMLSNSGVRDVVIIKRDATPVEQTVAPSGSFDPLEGSQPRRSLPKK